MKTAGCTLIAVASSLALLASCAGSSQDNGSSESAAPSTSSSRSVSAFMAALNAGSSDYNEEASPEDMAEHSDSIVEGRIVALNEGRSYGSAIGAIDTITRVSATINVTRTLKGPAASTVYLELDASSVQLEEMRATLPTSTTGIFYLTDRSSPSVSTEILNPNAGRPQGQPIYVLASPQGGVLPDGQSSVEFMTGTEYPDTSITDFTPSQTEFPPSEDDI